MSLIVIFAALSATTASPGADDKIGRADWDRVAAAARRLEIPANTLYRALTVREAPRSRARDARLCVRRDDFVVGKTGMVCRTQTQWAALGIDIDAPKG